MKKVAILVISALVTGGVVMTAQAEEEAYEWREKAGLEKNDPHKAALNNVNAFPSQPGEIWNWREEEGVPNEGVKESDCFTSATPVMADSYSRKHYKSHYKHKKSCK